MYTSILRRWSGLGIAVVAALLLFLLTQNLMEVSAQGQESEGIGHREKVSEMVSIPTSLTLELGTQFTTTSAVTDDQRMVDVAYNSVLTQYMTVWQDERNGNEDIYGQLTDSEGDNINSDIALVTGNGTQTDPHIAYSPDTNRYLLVWVHNTGINWDVYGRLLNSSGQPISETISIDGNFSDNSLEPDVVYDTNSDHFLVVWSRGSGHASILARAVGTNAGLGSIFIVAETTGGGPNKDDPAVAADGSGTFLVTWQEDEGTSADILGQRVSITTTVGSLITITDAGDNQDQPALAYHSGDNEYLVVWTDKYSSTRRLMARFVDQNGTLPGSIFEFEDPGSNLDLHPEVLALTHGYLVGYHWEATTLDVRIGSVTLNGMVENIQYLSQASNNQLRVALAGSGTTGLALWETNEKGDYDIYGKVVTLTTP